MENKQFRLCMYGCGNQCKEVAHDVDAWSALFISPLIFIGVLLFNSISPKDR